MCIRDRLYQASGVELPEESAERIIDLWVLIIDSNFLAKQDVSPAFPPLDIRGRLFFAKLAANQFQTNNHNCLKFSFVKSGGKTLESFANHPARNG